VNTSRMAPIAYAAFGLLTFLYQLPIRLDHCAGLGRCTLSLVKGIVWSVIWPVYWFAKAFFF